MTFHFVDAHHFALLDTPSWAAIWANRLKKCNKKQQKKLTKKTPWWTLSVLAQLYVCCRDGSQVRKLHRINLQRIHCLRITQFLVPLHCGNIRLKPAVNIRGGDLDMRNTFGLQTRWQYWTIPWGVVDKNGRTAPSWLIITTKLLSDCRFRRLRLCIAPWCVSVTA